MTAAPAAERPSRSRLLLLLAAAGWLGWCSFAPARYTYGDSCLSHARGEVLVAPSAMPPRVPFFDRGSGIPDFVVPFADPRATLNMPQGFTGLLVSYQKHPGRYEAVRLIGPQSAYRACARTPAEYGLSRIDEVEEGECQLRPAVIPRVFYQPTTLPEGFADVRLRCHEDAVVKACRLWATMPNDWELSMALPKPLIPEWPAALAAARDFFDAHLTDCGP